MWAQIVEPDEIPRRPEVQSRLKRVSVQMPIEPHYALISANQVILSAVPRFCHAGVSEFESCQPAICIVSYQEVGNMPHPPDFIHNRRTALSLSKFFDVGLKPFFDFSFDF